MFDKQYRFTGSHAQKVSELTSVFDERAKATLFHYNYDVYINAPLIGFLYNRKSEKNNLKSSDMEVPPQNIFAEQMINNSEQLKYILRLILILDTQYEPVLEKRLDKAFRNLGKDDNDLALFDSYVLGGVDVLYEKLIEGASNSDDYINNMYDFIEEFNERFNEEITNESILELCRESNNM